MSKTSIRSPYSLSPRESRVTFFKPVKSEGVELYNAFRERKKVTDHLITMQNRIKQLEKEETKTQKKIESAKQHIDAMNELKNRKRREKAERQQFKLMKKQQLEELREKNKQKRLEIKETIEKHKGIVLEERKQTVKELKDFIYRQKQNVKNQVYSKHTRRLSSNYKTSIENSPRPNHIKEKIMDEKNKTMQNWNEIKALEEKEKELLSRLEAKSQIQQKYLSDLKSVISSKN